MASTSGASSSSRSSSSSSRVSTWMAGDFNFVESLHDRLSEGRWAGGTSKEEGAAFSHLCEQGGAAPS
eukprot:11766367-Prorocentrum_lima.AAC.1